MLWFWIEPSWSVTLWLEAMVERLVAPFCSRNWLISSRFWRFWSNSGFYGVMGGLPRLEGIFFGGCGGRPRVCSACISIGWHCSWICYAIGKQVIWLSSGSPLSVLVLLDIL